MPDLGFRATADVMFEILLSKYLVHTCVCIKYDILFGFLCSSAQIQSPDALGG